MFFSFPAVLLFACAAICRSRLESDDVLLQGNAQGPVLLRFALRLFLEEKNLLSFFLSFFGKLDFGGPEFTRYFCRSSALPPNLVMRFLFNPSKPPLSAFFSHLFIIRMHSVLSNGSLHRQAQSGREGGKGAQCIFCLRRGFPHFL